jgi:surface antigen
MNKRKGDIMSRIAVLAASLLLPLAAACESTPPSKEDIGMVTGAVLGGVIGHQVGKGTGQTVATIGGAALGGYIGNRVGRNMDREDADRASHALDKSADGESTTWRSQESGTRYSITPKRTYEGSTGICRDFTSVMEVNGRDELMHGTACKQPDGSWKPQ